METLKRVIGVVLIVIAAIIAIHTIIEPIYHVSTEDSPTSSIWGYINPFSAISIILGLIFRLHSHEPRRREFERSKFIAANTLFYGFVCVGIIFFWNWFGISGIGQDFTAVAETPED